MLNEANQYAEMLLAFGTYFDDGSAHSRLAIRYVKPSHFHASHVVSVHPFYRLCDEQARILQCGRFHFLCETACTTKISTLDLNNFIFATLSLIVLQLTCSRFSDNATRTAIHVSYSGFLYI